MRRTERNECETRTNKRQEEQEEEKNSKNQKLKYLHTTFSTSSFVLRNADECELTYQNICKWKQQKIKQ